MIRPREGNFSYNQDEIKSMISEIYYCKEIGVKEIVFGFLTNDGQVDIETTSKLSAIAYPMKVTFHKAIDKTQDIYRGIEILCGIDNVTSVLTSAGKKNALDGKDIIKKILKGFSSELNIIVAGSITKDNFSIVDGEIGAREYHGKKIVGDLVL